MTHIDTFDRIVTPLHNGWQCGTLIPALPTNAEGRNGQFRDGGHYQTGWLDAYQAHTLEKHLSVRVTSARRKEGRAIRGASQQSRRDVFRTVQNATPRQNSEVVSASSTGACQFAAVKPRRLPRRTIVPRHAYCMPYGNNRQGRVEGDSMEQVPIYCQWCHYTERRPAPFLYGSIPLCARCYRYASESDRDTRKRLDMPVVLPRRKVRTAA